MQVFIKSMKEQELEWWMSARLNIKLKHYNFFGKKVNVHRIRTRYVEINEHGLKFPLESCRFE